MNQLQTKQTTNSEGDFFVLKEQATMLLKSGFLPQAIKTPEQAIAIILTGRELGIGTMAALNTINVIQGKPTISPQLMLALIERSGQLENIEIKTDTDGVTVVMTRKGRTPHTERFGAKEANALNLMTKDNYKKQASTMFKWRAVAACARVVFPDVILGFYAPEEMGAAVNEDGEMLPQNVTEFPKSLPAQTIENELRRAEYEVAMEEKGLPVEPENAELDAAEQSLMQQFKELLDKLELPTDKYGQYLAKYGKLKTLGEREDAVATVRQQVEKKQFEADMRAISDGLAAQDWDEEELDSYLVKFGITKGLINATPAQLADLFNDMKNGKMI